MRLVIANQSADWCGNPFFWHFRYGFPRRCVHRLGMTGKFRILQQALFDTSFESKLPIQLNNSLDYEIILYDNKSVYEMAGIEMNITNNNFSAEETRFLEFILSQPFSEKDTVKEYINTLEEYEIFRNYSPYFRIIEFRTKGILPDYNSGMRALISVQVLHHNGCAPTVFTLYEKDGLPFEYEIYNADSSEMNMDTLLEGELYLET